MSVLSEFRDAYGTRWQRPARTRPPRPALLTVLARTLGTLAAIVLGFVRRGRSEVLTIGALGCGVAGAFQYGLASGLFGLMAAGLILEWLLRAE